MVRQSDIRELDMSVDEALKYVISLGMVVPDELLAKETFVKLEKKKTTS